MNRAARGTYPLPVGDVEDPRFAQFVKRTAALAEQEGFPRLDHAARVDLAAKLLEFLYVSRGAAGEIEKRLNSTVAPLVSDEGGVDSYECAAVAHELRRKRGAEGAIVIALDERSRVHIGMAMPKEPGSQADLLAARLMRQIDDVAHLHIQDVVLDLVVEDDGQGRPS